MTEWRPAAIIADSLMSDDVITIDGPAASGKSTVARALAERLGFSYLDTGALYRAITLKAMREGVDPQSPQAVEQMLAGADVGLRTCSGGLVVVLDGTDVSEEIRASEVAERVKVFADNPRVRGFVNDLARGYARGRRIVAEGRDQGTIVFPGARWKFFLTASLSVRAGRRHREDAERGRSVSREETERALAERDASDRARKIAPLVSAADAFEVDTSKMSAEEVVSFLEERVRRGFEDE